MKKTLTFLLFSALMGSASAQNGIYAYGDTVNTDYGYDLIRTGGNLTLAGKTASYPDFSDFLYSDALLMQVTLNGVINWAKKYQLNVPLVDNIEYDRSDIFWRVRPTTVGTVPGFITVGASGDTTGLPSLGVLIANMNAAGDVQWSKIIDGAGFGNGGYDVVPVADGYVLAGSLLSAGAVQGIDMLLAKFDLNGDIVFSKIIGAAGTQICRAMAQTADGGFLLVGTHTASGASADMLIVKTNANGTVQWSRTLGGAGDDRAIAIMKNDNNYIITGNVTLNNAEDIIVLAINDTGAIQWQRVIATAGTDIGNGLSMKGNNILLAGSTNGGTGSSTDGALFELSPTDGSIINASTTGKQFGEIFYATVYDGTNVFSIGNTGSLDLLGGNDVMLTKHNATNLIAATCVATLIFTSTASSLTLNTFTATTNIGGSVRNYPLRVTNINMNTQYEDCYVATKSEQKIALTVAPNPTNGAVQVQLPTRATVSVHDTFGRLLAQINLAEGAQIIDLSSYAQGVYSLSFIFDNANIVTKKVVKF